MAATPYVDLPAHRFWRKAVAEVPPSAVDPIIDLPFEIRPEDKVATGGSCFAQHIANRLQSSGLQYYQPEQAPAGMSVEEAAARGYGMYSCRYGNIYTTRQLLQLFDRAFGLFKPTLDWWQRPDGRYVDPFRPRIEPDGFATIEDLHADRRGHLAAVRTMFETMDVFLFTFGLTESWVHKEDGAVLQLAPGVAGGEWSDSQYAFWNARASEVASDYLAFVDKLRAINPDVRLIVSVSPVPIIATYMPRHALVSNSASKSTLRVACDEVVAARPEIAYFPSYDLVSFGPNAARYYKENLRELNPVGLSAVMNTFFRHFAAKKSTTGPLPCNGARDPGTESATTERYRVFPARPWSVLTPRQLLQLFDRAYGLFWPNDDAWLDKDGAFIDPFRPHARDGGFVSRDALERDRDLHFAAVRNLFEASGDLIVTFEVTDGWEALSDGAVFLSRPPLADSMEPIPYRLRRFDVAEMEADTLTFIEKLRRINPGLRLIFTVSPAALAFEIGRELDSDKAGKDALRAVVDRITHSTKNTMYFPSYEMITGPRTPSPTSEDGLGGMSGGDLAQALSSFSSGHGVGNSGPLDRVPRAEGDSVPAAFDANASISHLQTVICDEVAIEESLQR